MTTRRILLTLDDVIHMIAEKYEAKITNINIYNSNEIYMDIGGDVILTGDHFLFQIDEDFNNG